jgi:hypothetical protein
MSIASQKMKTELSLAQKGTLVKHTEALAYEKSTAIIRERQCGPLTLREMLT